MPVCTWIFGPLPQVDSTLLKPPKQLSTEHKVCTRAHTRSAALNGMSYVICS